jgi:mannose-6-phosphate isomerase-like protein (cupin superfamily)
MCFKTCETFGLVEKKSAEKIAIAKTCTIYEYPLSSSVLSLITAKIHGRYPESGKSVNSACEQIYYVISGSGTLHTDRGTHALHPGDVYSFLIGEAYFVEGNELNVVVTNSPAWKKEQYYHLDEDN